MAGWYEDYLKSRSAGFTPLILSAEDEAKFKNWLTALPWYKDIEARVPKGVDLFAEMTGPESDYDYRRAWAHGAEPQLYPYDNSYHWVSSLPDGTMLKSPTHPTAWMEYFMREMNIDPNAVGLENAEQANTWSNQLYSVVNKTPKLW